MPTFTTNTAKYAWPFNWIYCLYIDKEHAMSSENMQHQLKDLYCSQFNTVGLHCIETLWVVNREQYFYFAIIDHYYYKCTELKKNKTITLYIFFYNLYPCMFFCSGISSKVLEWKYSIIPVEVTKERVDVNWSYNFVNLLQNILSCNYIQHGIAKIC